MTTLFYTLAILWGLLMFLPATVRLWSFRGNPYMTSQQAYTDLINLFVGPVFLAYGVKLLVEFWQ